MDTATSQTEVERLESCEHGTPWKFWGPYLSERQWGTVREDYSADGNAWAYFTHDQARSRSYKWGEDGLAGISDERQRLCWALALWNGNDPILKERLFGLTGPEGNHGEDVKEYYFYLDSTPTHSWMRFLYKYPQAAFPYADLVETNAARSRDELEYELLDTGVFAEDRYFDVFVSYAKADAHDLLIEIEVINRGPDPADLHVLPQLWFRDTWWKPGAPTERPMLHALGPGQIVAQHPELGRYVLSCEGAPPLLFTENATNTERLWAQPNAQPYVKDAFHRYLIAGETTAINPAQTGTKAAAHYQIMLAPGAQTTLRLRLTQVPHGAPHAPFTGYAEVLAQRFAEANAFYAHLTPPAATADQAQVIRQALAGMLWTKQYYEFDLDLWLEERGANPLSGGKNAARNRDWVHLLNGHIISMPDKWEYPWYAAWDLAFHTLALSMVDLRFAREQLDLMLHDTYLHPNGQIPAYEWNFGDVNPPVHAWATLFAIYGDPSRDEVDPVFVKESFNRLLLNFNWWVNRKDPGGRNVFSGGFLGLDNIGVFDRSAPLPTGGYLEQADGTAWMAFYSQNMFELAVFLAHNDPAYEDFMLRFLQHFLWIGGSMDRVGYQGDELWDEEDGFFYDLLILPDGSAKRIKLLSMVGLLPLIATATISVQTLERFPSVVERANAFIARKPELVANLHPLDRPGVQGRRLLAVVNERKLRRILSKLFDEAHFLGPYGIRSLSRYHLEHPFELTIGNQTYRVQYLPAESDNAMFGGNSNWRGPVWLPVNVLLIRALLQFYAYYGDDFKVELPTGSGQLVTLFEAAKELSERLTHIFLRNADGLRPVFGGSTTFQADPHWRDQLLFYEYFHGDNGAGLGASHQTGWTGLIARLIYLFGTVTPAMVLEEGMRPLARILRPVANE